MDNKYNIYENSKDNKYRYALGRKGKKTLICIGINPSKATSIETDVTITKVENITYKKGKAKNITFSDDFDSFIMLNIYPLRATNPKNLPKNIINVENTPEHKKNVETILKLINDNSIIWVAWGNLIHSRDWLKICLNDIMTKIEKNKKGIKWVKMGDLTTKNEPQHPSHVRYQKFSRYVKA